MACVMARSRAELSLSARSVASRSSRSFSAVPSSKVATVKMAMKGRATISLMRCATGAGSS